MAVFRGVERLEVWDRRQAGKLSRSIGRSLGRTGASIRALIESTGGVRPAARKRCAQLLILVEREEISRGLASNESLCEIAQRLGRALHRRCLGRWPVTVAVTRIGHTKATGQRFGVLAARNLPNLLATRRCVVWLRRNLPIGGHGNRFRAGYITRILTMKGCVCRTKRSTCHSSSRAVAYSNVP